MESPIPPSPSRENPLVCLLAYDGLCAFEYGIGLEVFGLPRPEFQRWFKVATVAVEPGHLRAIGGINVVAEADLDRLSQAKKRSVESSESAWDAPVEVSYHV